MGEIIAIASVKGGVGKTVLAAQLAGLMYEQGRQILAIDADPHASLTSWACGGPLAEIVRHEPLRSVKRIGEWVELLRDARMNNDVVLIDLSSTNNSAITTALMVCQHLMIPIGPSLADIHGTDQTMKLLHLARRSRKDPPLLWMVPNRFDSRAKAADTVLDYAASLEGIVTPPIGTRSSLGETAAQGHWAGRDKAGKKARAEIESVISMLDAKVEEQMRSVA